MTGTAAALSIGGNAATSTLATNAVNLTGSGTVSATATGGAGLVPNVATSADKAGLPQNSQSAAYTTVLADANKHILHPAADNNARTFTIDSNANVAYIIGTAITFVNQINTLTVAITTDTLTWANTSLTGSRTLSVNGIATAVKISTTGWLISGTGLS